MLFFPFSVLFGDVFELGLESGVFPQSSGFLLCHKFHFLFELEYFKVKFDVLLLYFSYIGFLSFLLFLHSLEILA
jgi:hypothetical protein